MRVFVETSAINWLADWPEDAERFFAFAQSGRFTPVVAIEVANEVRRTRDPKRLQTLEAVLSRFFPLAPTYLPRLGAFRSGMGMATDSRPGEMFVDLGFLTGGVDRTHLVNAHRHNCELFLTRDAEMLRERVKDIEALLGVTRLAHPRTFLAKLQGSGPTGGH